MKILKSKKTTQRENTRNLQYETLKEQHIEDVEKIAKLQERVISMQDVILNQKEKLLLLREKEIGRLGNAKR